MNLKRILAYFTLALAVGCSDSGSTLGTAAPEGLSAEQRNAETPTALMHPAAYFQAGPLMAANQVVIYFDAQCPHCGFLWNELKPAIESGALSARWAPVKFLNQMSMAQGVMLVKSEDPPGSMTMHESLLRTATRGIKIDKSQLDTATIQKIELNTKKMIRNKEESVPALFVQRKDGRVDKYQGPLNQAQILNWIAAGK